MKNLVVYSTRTGNTKKLAQAIQNALPEAVLAAVEEGVCADEFDNVFIGFWCDKGAVDEKALNYLNSMKPRKVAIFGTMGEDPKSERAVAFAQRVKNSVLAHLEVLDLRIWQGRIDPKVLEYMSKLPNMPPMTPERQARIDEAAKHPDENDCRQAAQWALDLVNR